MIPQNMYVVMVTETGRCGCPNFPGEIQDGQGRAGFMRRDGIGGIP